jgi:hypothetical protein
LRAEIAQRGRGGGGLAAARPILPPPRSLPHCLSPHHIHMMRRAQTNAGRACAAECNAKKLRRKAHAPGGEEEDEASSARAPNVYRPNHHHHHPTPSFRVPARPNNHLEQRLLDCHELGRVQAAPAAGKGPFFDSSFALLGRGRLPQAGHMLDTVVRNQRFRNWGPSGLRLGDGLDWASDHRWCARTATHLCLPASVSVLKLRKHGITAHRHRKNGG